MPDFNQYGLIAPNFVYCSVLLDSVSCLSAFKYVVPAAWNAGPTFFYHQPSYWDTALQAGLPCLPTPTILMRIEEKP
jgi:hypothetical protein